MCLDICPEDCHGNGECISNRCWCYPGYSGYQCNETLIEGTCNQFNLLYGRIGELSVNINQSLYKNPINCHYLIQVNQSIDILTYNTNFFYFFFFKIFFKYFFFYTFILFFLYFIYYYFYLFLLARIFPRLLANFVPLGT